MIVECLKNPKSIVLIKSSFAEKARELLRIYIFCNICFFLGHILTSFLDYLLSYKTGFSFHELIDRLQEKESGATNVLFFILIAPIAEEIIFRLPLRLTKLNFFTALVLFYMFLVFNFNAVGFLEVIKALALTILLYFTIFHLVGSRFFELISDKYFNSYFYSVAMVFGLLHVINFISYVPSQLMPFAVIFTLNQVISGFILGYARMRLGVVWSIILHVLINLLPVISYYL